MSQTFSPSKNVMMPSSLTFRTGPNLLAASAAVVRAPFHHTGLQLCRWRMPENGAGGKQARVRIRRRWPRRGRRARRVRWDRDRSATGPRAARAGPVATAVLAAPSRGAARRGDRRARRSSPPHSCRERQRTAHLPAHPRDRARSERSASPAPRLRHPRPQSGLRLQIEQVPRRAAEGKDLRAFRKDLDLARRGEHGTHVPMLQRRARVRLIRLRARHLQRLMPAHLTAPPLDVDDVQQPAFRVGEKHLNERRRPGGTGS